MDISLGNPKQSFAPWLTRHGLIYLCHRLEMKNRLISAIIIYITLRASSTYVGSHTNASMHWNGWYTSGFVSQDTLHVTDLHIQYQKFGEASKFRPVP